MGNRKQADHGGCLEEVHHNYFVIDVARGTELLQLGQEVLHDAHARL